MTQPRMTTAEARQEIERVTRELAAFSEDTTTARRAFLRKNPDCREQVNALTDRRHHLNRIIRRNDRIDEIDRLNAELAEAHRQVGEKDDRASRSAREAATLQNDLDAARRKHARMEQEFGVELCDLRFKRNAWCVGMILAVAICLLAEAV